ncbi:MAG TPA: hypothetical protein VKE22_09620 [Haliangiales bacterium]|nr:hypothetical protein [Haliangiales bacterium]
MFAPDSLVMDVIFPATARPTPEQVTAGLGGEAVAKTRAIADIDLDLPQVEMELSPTFLVRKRGDRRVFIVDDASPPLRRNPRTEPIVPRDLRPERDRLVKLVEATGAKIGRLGAFGAWGDAAVVVRAVRDLRALMLLAWALDPTYDLEGRRRASQLTKREFEMKLGSFDKRLDELDDAMVLARVPPARLQQVGELTVVDVLDAKTGHWDVRKSYEMEKRVGAVELFSRIPGAKHEPPDDAAPAPPPPRVADAPPPPPPAPEPPALAGDPITVLTLAGRLVLRIPADRLTLDLTTALGKRQLDFLGPKDKVSGKQKDQLYQDGGGFVAPLAFLSEAFVDGKPLDKRRFLADAEDRAGVRTLVAHLPRFGAVRIIEAGGARWITSEVDADVGELLRALG